MSNKCTQCEVEMKSIWPKIAHLLRICPNCCKDNVKRKLSYKMFGRNKAPASAQR